jgi:hypothetical protein
MTDASLETSTLENGTCKMLGVFILLTFSSTVPSFVSWTINVLEFVIPFSCEWLSKLYSFFIEWPM